MEVHFCYRKKIKKVIVTFYLASQTFFILCITIWALFPRNSEKKIIISRYILIIVSLYIVRSKFRILTFFLAILSLASLTFFWILSLHFTILNISLNSEFTPLSSVFLFPPRGGVTIRWSLNSPHFWNTDVHKLDFSDMQHRENYIQTETKKT